MWLIILIIKVWAFFAILGLVVSIFEGHEESVEDHKIAYRAAMSDVKVGLTDQKWADIQAYMLSCPNYGYRDLDKIIRERNKITD